MFFWLLGLLGFELCGSSFASAGCVYLCVSE